MHRLTFEVDEVNDTVMTSGRLWLDAAIGHPDDSDQLAVGASVRREQNRHYDYRQCVADEGSGVVSHVDIYLRRLGAVDLVRVLFNVGSPVPVEMTVVLREVVPVVVNLRSIVAVPPVKHI